MANQAKDTGPTTTIWREQGGTTVLVETIRGLPFGTPNMGARVPTQKYGEARCTGVRKSGTGKNEQVVEVKLTVK